MQNAYFKDKDKLKNVANNPHAAKTTLTEWLLNNRYDARGRHLCYIDYILEYRWDASYKCWIRKSFRTKPATGRLIYVHPTCGQLFYLLMLLTHQRGCQTFKDIRRVNGQACTTYRDACEKLGLLQDDNEWSTAINETAFWATASELRTLFTHMLLYCEVSSPEKNYDRHTLGTEHASLKQRLNNEQLQIYDYVTISLETNKQVLAFVYGHGGTGKTFLWTTIISGLRSHGRIVLAVAASGIASLLLPSGKTAHSRFKIPLDLTDDSTCNVKKNTHLAQLLIETSLIIWDEALMSDRKCLESLDRTLNDLNNDDRPFGGKSKLLGGDIRQALPVKCNVSKEAILASSLPRSYLWNTFQVFKLTENMRLQRPDLDQRQIAEIYNFSSWLLAIGDGNLGTPDKNDPQNTKTIEIPSNYIIPFLEKALTDLIHFIYDDDTL
uniref:uncharacterized protein LOC122591461 n=1 Tax=Erigeron canadensis TaxID=72917 RepID=UPI001CB9B3AF|nr:uncharacterized protein LOC122591461 [Erigeron canadensis]